MADTQHGPQREMTAEEIEKVFKTLQLPTKPLPAVPQQTIVLYTITGNSPPLNAH